MAERFWAKVNKSGPVPEHRPKLGRCWVWTASSANGYGQYRIRTEVEFFKKAHRYSWFLHHGPIPTGLYVLHACDNPLCVNPDHLFLGTHTDNARDRERKGRGNTSHGDAHYMRRCPHLVKRGEQHGFAKLSATDAAEIRAAYARGGISYSQLGKRYGVCAQTVCNIVLMRSHQSDPYVAPVSPMLDGSMREAI